MIGEEEAFTFGGMVGLGTVRRCKVDMKEIKLYTFEDAKKSLDEGKSDSEVALKKWESILEALKSIEDVAIQITSLSTRSSDARAVRY